MSRADHDERPGIVFTGVTVLRDTPGALHVSLAEPLGHEPRTFWVPRSQVERQEGTELVVSGWWYGQQEWAQADVQALVEQSKRPCQPIGVAVGAAGQGQDDAEQ